MSRSAPAKKPVSPVKSAVPTPRSDAVSTVAASLDAATPDDASPDAETIPQQTGQRMTDRKREAIIEAAVQEFRRNGFEATSMDRIASAAEVSKRTVYNHFPSKDVLFAEILNQLYQRIHAQLTVPYSAERPLRDQLQELLEQKMQLLNDNNFIDLARVAISEAIHSPERARDMVSRMNEREEGLTVWIRAAVADGKLNIADPAFAANQLQGLIKGFAFWPQISFSHATLTPAMQKQVIDAAVEMFLRCYS